MHLDYIAVPGSRWKDNEGALAMILQRFAAVACVSFSLQRPPP